MPTQNNFFAKEVLHYLLTQRSELFLSLTSGAKRLEAMREALLATPSAVLGSDEPPLPGASLALDGSGLFLLAARAVRLALSFLSRVASSC